MNEIVATVIFMYCSIGFFIFHYNTISCNLHFMIGFIRGIFWLPYLICAMIKVIIKDIKNE